MPHARAGHGGANGQMVIAGVFGQWKHEVRTSEKIRQPRTYIFSCNGERGPRGVRARTHRALRSWRSCHGPSGAIADLRRTYLRPRHDRISRQQGVKKGEPTIWDLRSGCRAHFVHCERQRGCFPDGGFHPLRPGRSSRGSEGRRARFRRHSRPASDRDGGDRQELEDGHWGWPARQGLEMLINKAVTKRPLAYCAPCSERTPHRYERVGINGRLTSRAICLICDNDSRQDPTAQKASNSSP